MEEIVNKFIEEGKREHEEMDAFIREFRTTNELLLKERNNSLSELEFEVYGLSRAINKAQMREVITLTVDQSMKKPRTQDNECYGINDLDTVIQSAAQELLENDHRNKNLEDGINRPDSKNRGSNSKIAIRRIDHINTTYSHETQQQEETLNEQLYSASAIEIDEKRPELKDLPSHLEKLSASSKLQRRLNPKVQDVVKDEIVRLFDSELIYPISDSPWGSSKSQSHQKIERGQLLLVLMGLLPTGGYYVSKWVKAQALPTNDARVVVKFLKGLFARFGVPKALISDRGTNFCNSQLEKDLLRYGVTHRISTTYHPQTNGQTKVTNRAIKRILERLVGYNPKDWSEKLNDALWAFRTSYKTPTRCTLFRMVYRKACHLPVEIEHKAYWALKQCNMDLMVVEKNRFIELNELMELRDGAYENTQIYKERTKKWH
ncbi:reverse transcriptase domain-containing protein [Tanacetum coccineum]